MSDQPPSTSSLATPTPPPPIMVNAKAGPDQWAAAIRYTLVTLAGIVGALGYTKMAGQFSGMLSVAAPLGWLIVFAMGQWKTRQQSLKLSLVADAAPDSVAKLKT